MILHEYFITPIEHQEYFMHPRPQPKTFSYRTSENQHTNNIQKTKQNNSIHNVNPTLLLKELRCDEGLGLFSFTGY